MIPINTRSQKCRLKRCWPGQEQTKIRCGSSGGVRLMDFSKLSSAPVLAFCLFSAAVTFGPLPVSSAQSPDQILKWTAVPVPQRVHMGGQLTITLTGTIEDGWHTYSLSQAPGGPIPTTIKLPPKQPFKLAGRITGTEPERIFDPNFSMETEIHADRVVYTLPITVDAHTTGGNQDLLIAVRFQACNDHICLPPATLLVKTSVKVDGNATAVSAPAADRISLSPAVVFPAIVASTTGGAPVLASPSSSVPVKQETVKPTVGAQSFQSFLLLAVAMGALSLLTPCVFPMIPITVSYFTNHSGGNRSNAAFRALVYSVGIVLTFTALGMLLSTIYGAGGVNHLAANPWVNLLITAIFLSFAFSLFGTYFIQVPSGLVNRINSLIRRQEGSEFVGALLMGFIFTLTSFTCTAPFVGTLLVMTAQGNWLWPLAGMLAFATVFAIPFFILALAPQLMSQLPKAGAWMNSVKVVMGFLEIAAAMKFLSNADMVWQWGIFTRPAVLAVWAGIGVMIVLYMLGCFRMKHDLALEAIGAARLTLAIFFLAATIWLIPGLFGRELGELESFLPPVMGTTASGSASSTASSGQEQPEWILNNYEEALQAAKQGNKLVFVDFTGYTCTNCRWMEANMFPRPEVESVMNRFVRVRLYTDGDGALYEHQQKMQQEKFGTVALPLYAILRSDGTTVATFSGLTRNSPEFVFFLQKALESNTALLNARQQDRDLRSTSAIIREHKSSTAERIGEIKLASPK
jgi:thiol:disulfide interchange protein